MPDKVEKYVSAMLGFDESLEEADGSGPGHSKFKNSQVAQKFLNQQDMVHWMKKHGLGTDMKAKDDLRMFVKEIFEAIDLDGSGTMDQEELIKALLCMGLSQNIQFAKRIIKVFRENQEKAQEK